MVCVCKARVQRLRKSRFRFRLTSDQLIDERGLLLARIIFCKFSLSNWTNLQDFTNLRFSEQTKQDWLDFFFFSLSPARSFYFCPWPSHVMTIDGHKANGQKKKDTTMKIILGAKKSERKLWHVSVFCEPLFGSSLFVFSHFSTAKFLSFLSLSLSLFLSFSLSLTCNTMTLARRRLFVSP